MRLSLSAARSTMLLALASTVLLALAVAIPAEAGAPKAKTEVTAKIVDSGLKGRVKSVSACEGGRKVQVYQTQNGMKSVIKKTRSKDNGKYSLGQVNFDPMGGKAFVEATERKRSSVTCKRGKSQRLF